MCVCPADCDMKSMAHSLASRSHCGEDSVHMVGLL